MYCINKRVIAVLGLLLSCFIGAQTASAAMAQPLSQVKVLKVESPGCGFENIADGQAQTRDRKSVV